MNKKKIIFFDIDGTLVTEDKIIPESTKKAIQYLQEKGHYTVIATGRAPNMFQHIQKELNISSYIAFNGQLVVCDGIEVHAESLDSTFIHDITTFAAQHNHAIGFGNHKDLTITHADHPLEKDNFLQLKLDYPAVDPDYYKQNTVNQLNLFCTEQEEIIYKEKYTDYKFVRWGYFGADVLPADSSKAIGIQKFIEYAGAAMENVYAFGDGENDIEMLSSVKNGVAMGNAVSELKDVASYVTTDCDQDGILYGLQHLGLIEPSFENDYFDLFREKI
ncbi:Cof-type HAD-IIB family hydrolase [Oceanobacillus oncorhynchi subsp. oncorhynchi]|uniref:Cof-type HAD-IIB family hydrolase n=1 Tax=Oceanobacillus oncorhynchi TaxID=545501 RepID=UPI0031DA8E7C